MPAASSLLLLSKHSLVMTDLEFTLALVYKRTDSFRQNCHDDFTILVAFHRNMPYSSSILKVEDFD